MLNNSLPTTVPVPTLEFKANNDTAFVMSSGLEAPAAMIVAPPITSGMLFLVHKICSAGTKYPSHITKYNNHK